MRFKYLLILSFLFFNSVVLFGQKSANIPTEEFPLKIGNIGFAVDSLEIVIGNIFHGKKYTQEIEIYNFGREPVTFRAGKSSPYLDVLYKPSVLEPGQSGVAVATLDVISELPFGPISAEIAIESDDKLNPYKFLYLEIGWKYSRRYKFLLTKNDFGYRPKIDF